MATVDKPGFIGRQRTLARDANPAFAVGSVAVPLLFFAAAVALDHAKLLFYTHVAAGAVWFSIAIIMPAVLGPSIAALSPAAAREFSAAFVPKIVFFVLGVSLTTVLSGSVLADTFGYLAAGDPWIVAAFAAGWGLWLFGLLVPNRMHLRAYYEGQSAEPNPVTMARIEKWNVAIGLFEAAIMLLVVLIMTNLRL